MKKDHLSLTDEDYSQLNTEYKAKDKEVKRLRKEDKIKIRLIESKLQEAETAEAKSDSKTLYMIVKELSGKPRGQMAPVRKLDGSVASTYAEQHQRWRQYFEEVLNCPEPVITHDFGNEDVIQLDTDTAPITHDEVKRAINSLKNGKAAGIDGMQAELIEAGG